MSIPVEESVEVEEDIVLKQSTTSHTSSNFPEFEELKSSKIDVKGLINKIFPDEASLINLEEFKTKLNDETKRNKDRIEALLQSQEDSKIEISQLKNNLKVSVESLTQKLNQIQIKTRMTVEAVNSVGKHIAKLEEGKKNLLNTISTVKKFHMLSTAIDQLEYMVSKRQYNEVGNLLGVIEELLVFFSSYREIEHINEIFKFVADTKLTLQNQIEIDFQSTFDEKFGGKPCTKDTLKGACIVINSLNIPYRNKICHIVVDSWLRSYKEAFSRSSMENIFSRYEWYAQNILEKDALFRHIFPESWDIFSIFTNKFCLLTSDQINSLLANLEENNIGAMMRGLQSTIEFEVFATKKFNASISGKVSYVFAPYLSSYVQREQTIIEEQVLKSNSEDLAIIQSILQGGKDKVMPSTINLFVAIKNSINRCLKFTKEKAFFDLYISFKTIFKKHYSHLNKELKSSISHKTDTVSSGFNWKLQGFSLKSGGETNSLEKKRNIKEDIISVCLILNSADYAAETLHQLEETIQNSIHTSYVSDVSLEKEQDLFYKNVSNSVHVLSSCIINYCSEEFKSLLDGSWGSFDEVGDTSPFIKSIDIKCEKLVGLILPLLSSTYYRSFCDKFAMSLIDTYFTSLRSLSKISHFASQQFLVDLKSFKNLLLKMPSRIQNSKKDTLFENHKNTYEKAVSQRLDRIEAVLKIVNLGVSLSMFDLVERVNLLLINPTDTELKAISIMRGMEKDIEEEFFNKIKLKRGTNTTDQDVRSMKEKLKNLKLSDINVTSFGLGSVMQKFSK